MKLENLLKNKDSKERASLKAKEIAKVAFRGKYKKDKLEIEIIDIQEIEGGVSVFVKVWKEKKQLSFGLDGSVEIERFNIYNPPILVSDENGEVERLIIDEKTQEITISRYTKNPKEAVLQVIEHNLSIMKNVHINSKKIKKDKIGKTTSTFYPEAGDGRVKVSNVTESWGTSRARSTGVGAGTIADYTSATMRCQSSNDGNGGPYPLVFRTFFPFDTSALPDTDDIDSAIFSAYVTAKSSNNQAAGTFALVQTTQASASSLVAGDFNQCGDLNTPDEGATRIAIGSISTSAYNNWTLNATGEGWINKTGNTYLGIREGGYDIDGANISTSSGTTRIDMYASEQAGTTNDPKLVIEHSAGASAFVATMQII